MCDRGGAWKVLKTWIAIWEIPIDHFDPNAARREASAAKVRRPLEDLLVRGSTIGSSHLKAKLYRAGLKRPLCELCGQGDEWRGRRMSLVLDHINGDRRDNRLENLRVVCPNCNATLDTHCGRNAGLRDRRCVACGTQYTASAEQQRFCSLRCAARNNRTGKPRLDARRVKRRPPYEQLVAEIAELGWVGVGRRYGVSDNAIRKWVKAYERALGCGDEAA